MARGLKVSPIPSPPGFIPCSFLSRFGFTTPAARRVPWNLLLHALSIALSATQEDETKNTSYLFWRDSNPRTPVNWDVGIIMVVRRQRLSRPKKVKSSTMSCRRHPSISLTGLTMLYKVDTFARSPAGGSVVIFNPRRRIEIGNLGCGPEDSQRRKFG